MKQYFNYPLEVSEDAISLLHIYKVNMVLTEIEMWCNSEYEWEKKRV